MVRMNATKILDWIMAQPQGTVISVPRVIREFPGQGTWTGASKLLATLAREGYLRRVRRGFYVGADGTPVPAVDTIPRERPARVRGVPQTVSPQLETVLTWIKTNAATRMFGRDEVIAALPQFSAASVSWHLRSLTNHGTLARKRRGTYMLMQPTEVVRAALFVPPAPPAAVEQPATPPPPSAPSALPQEPAGEPVVAPSVAPPPPPPPPPPLFPTRHLFLRYSAAQLGDMLLRLAAVLNVTPADVQADPEIVYEALVRQQQQTAAPSLCGVLLHLRREPEGHFTLLLECPGAKRRALGLVRANVAGAPEEDDVGEIVERFHGTVRHAVVIAWQEKGK